MMDKNSGKNCVLFFCQEEHKRLRVLKKLNLFFCVTLRRIHTIEHSRHTVWGGGMSKVRQWHDASAKFPYLSDVCCFL